MNLPFLYSCFDLSNTEDILDKLLIDEILEIRKFARQNKNSHIPPGCGIGYRL